MKDFSKFIIEPNVNQRADTNEIIGILLASACLAYACAPIVGAIGGGLNSFFSNLFSGDKKDNKDNKNDNKDNKNDNKDSKDDKKSIDAFNSLLMLSRQANEKEKDANTKKKNDAMIKLITSCSFDKDGNQVPLDQIADKMKDTMSPEQFEAFKKDMTETYEKNKDNQDFKDQLVKAKANIKPEEYDKMIEDAKKEAKATLEQLDNEKREIEEYDNKIQELDDQINGGDEKDKEIRELKKQLEELKNNPPQTLVGSATGVSSTGTTTTTDSEDEQDTKSDEDTDTKPKEKTKEEKDAIDDNDTHDTEKDETKQGKYKVKDEEVTDPKTGGKIKVKTYTGPRGGKFYYPKGSPKTPENKVYVESVSLRDYLLECLI